MNSTEILAELGARNVRPLLVGDKLKLRGPADRITPELVERVRACKTELLGLLAADRQRPGIARIDLLNAERREADRQARRGYDFDATAPSHADYVPKLGRPAYGVVIACERYGVALRVDANGDLVVGKAGAKAGEPTQPWASLLVCIQAHLEAVARLVEAGWTLKANFPKTTAA